MTNEERNSLLFFGYALLDIMSKSKGVTSFEELSKHRTESIYEYIQNNYNPAMFETGTIQQEYIDNFCRNVIMEEDYAEKKYTIASPMLYLAACCFEEACVSK